MEKEQMLIAKGFVEKSDSEDGLLDVSVASSSVVDRDGESINQDGWDLKNFKKNPQLLWAHNMREVKPPIGKITKIWFEGEGKAKVMKFKAMFDMADEFAKEIHRKIKDGFLNAFSVGFMPTEREGTTYTKAELLEISVVPVPSNPAALVEIRSKGIEPMEWKDFDKVEHKVLMNKPVEPIVEPAKEPVKPTEPIGAATITQENGEDLNKINPEEFKKMIREMLDENKKPVDKDMDNLQDALRIVYQAVGIALKKIKDLKGGE